MCGLLAGVVPHLWLEVSVDHPLLVHGLHRRDQLQEQGAGPSLREAVLQPEPVQQLPPLQQLHHNVHVQLPAGQWERETLADSKSTLKNSDMHTYTDTHTQYKPLHVYCHMKQTGAGHSCTVSP